MVHKRPPRPRRLKNSTYDFNVFLNCPFDDEYQPLFRAMIFSIHACGFIARCAQEVSNQNIRFSRILEIIGESRYGIHDLSRISLEANVMPRNNMPLELGVFIGCRNFGKDYDYDKEYLVLDSIPHRYKEHITDLGGEDPLIHNNSPEQMVRCIRDWLVLKAPVNEKKLIPSPSILFEQLTRFYTDAPDICKFKGLMFSELLFVEYVDIDTDWLRIERNKLEEFNRLEDKLNNDYANSNTNL